MPNGFVFAALDKQSAKHLTSSTRQQSFTARFCYRIMRPRQMEKRQNTDSSRADKYRARIPRKNAQAVFGCWPLPMLKMPYVIQPSSTRDAKNEKYLEVAATSSTERVEDWITLRPNDFFFFYVHDVFTRVSWQLIGIYGVPRRASDVRNVLIL